MVLLVLLGLLLLVGVALTVWWGGTSYRVWAPEPGEEGIAGANDEPEPPRPSLRGAALRYLLGVAVALVGGFWAGALVTGPAVRLVIRLLAVTAGDDAQGSLTEAEEVVGDIDLGGTLGLYVSGGVLPGLLSGAIYLVVRRWLPSGRLGGIAFGVLHLVLAATRIDPLRPDNRIDIVGPGWLSVITFAAVTILHGMAVVAIANRFSSAFPPETRGRSAWARVLVPLAPRTLMLIPGVFLLLPLTAGLGAAVVASQIPPLARLVRSRAAVLGGRLALAIVAVAMLPGTVSDLRDVVVRDPPAVVPDSGTAR